MSTPAQFLIPTIAGCGLVTPLGRSVDETWKALLAGNVITAHAALAGNLEGGLPRVASLAIEAAVESIADAGWGDIADQTETAIIVGTSKGPVERWLSTATHRGSTSENPSGPVGRMDFGLGEIAAAVAEQTGLTVGPRVTLSAACASGLHALIRGCMMIESGEIRRVLVVAAEASVHPLFLASFDRLGVLPPAGVPCRPFDEHRRGFLMSDTAAAVCLEASNDPGISVDRFALGGDATHLTGSKSEGAVLSKLLIQVMPPTVDLIHAHGTGTVLNDAIELAALESQLDGYNQPLLYSHKAALGHSLGASGLVSVVINCLCHRHGRVPGNINTRAPLPHSKLTVSTGVQHREIQRSIVIASGFGGPTAVVSLNMR